MNNLAKWRETIIINFSKIIAYRVNFLLTIIGPAVVAFFIKYQLWSAIYSSHPETTINGYSLSQMINYHVWALIIALAAQGKPDTDIPLEIRYGKISSYLIYPFNFWEFHFASFVAFESVQITISLITLSILTFAGIVNLPPLTILVSAFLYCILVSTFWFLIQFLTGIMAFWLEETWMLRVLLQIIATFLSGAVIPLDFFPAWAVELLNYTPFPYMTYYPIKILLGESVPWAQGIAVLSGWMIFIIATNILVWRKGIRSYSAAGM